MLIENNPRLYTKFAIILLDERLVIRTDPSVELTLVGAVDEVLFALEYV